MAIEQIGIVTKIVGEVTATSATGEIRILTVGDKVFPDEIIETSNGAYVEIQFTDGSKMDLAANSEAMLDAEVFDPDAAGGPAAGEAVASVEAIQAAILAGEDPTLVAPAAAAGEDAVTEDDGSSFIRVEHENPSVTPESGINTGVQTIGFAQTFDELPPDELLPTLSINDVTVVEPDITGGEGGAYDEEYYYEQGMTLARFTVTLSTVSNVDVSVDYVTADGTAIAGGLGVGEDDYGSTSGTLIIPAGSTEGYIDVWVFGDLVDESTEQYLVLLSDPQNATIEDGTGVGTILDNDEVTVASVTSDEQTEGTDLVHTVTLSGAADHQLSFAYSLVQNTATETDDYLVPPTFSDGVTLDGGNLLVPAGVTSFTITTATVDDDLAELDGEFYDLTVGGVAATGTINDNDVAEFPAGLAYSVAGGGNTGAILYGIDLETGATFAIGPVVVEGNDKAQFSSLTLNPDDGYLYGLADQGNLNGFVKINPATGEAELISTDSLFNTSTSGMSFALDGTLYMAVDDDFYIINPETGDYGAPIASFNNSGVSVDAFAYDSGSDTFFFVSGSQLYSMKEGDTTATAIGPGIGDTIDGLSFDESGSLWGTDNLGTIYLIDTTTGVGTVVATISNSDVTNSGIHSLAISILEPGTYVTLTDAGGTETHTEWYAFDPALVVDNLDETDTGFTDTDTSVDVTIEGRTVTVTQSGPSDVDEVAIRVDSSADVTVDGFEQTDVFTRDGSPSSVTVTDAERGTIQTGEGDDVITVDASAAGGAVAGGEIFVIDTDGGDDTITLSDLVDSSYIVNAGEGLDGGGNPIDIDTDIDTVVIDGNIDLGAGPLSLSNVEVLDITGSADNTVTLSVVDVLDATDTSNTLVILGDSGDVVESGDTWTANGTQDFDGVTYDAYISGGATLLVDSDLDVSGIT
ncbi:MAG: retention module-containing protein [Gammaproteobacteria bacterium]|nr:retention module-containing protein [Gammaproteobacteria bacterium]